MIDELKEVFVNIKKNNCFKIITEEHFEIYDCKTEDASFTIGRCYIKESGDFQVLNPNKQEISFLAVDKCIFFDEDDTKRCDAIVYNNDTICFIEIKDCKPKNRSSRKKDAKEQLRTTIKLFENKINIEKNREAYMCVGTSQTRPSKLASGMDAVLEFEEDVNSVLFDGCKKNFVE
ncbi:MAG: hypothetical protein U9N42_09705 [Campylobacterota bacterium]|nr:hypothetical protein [Campylobacterota bacterium]